MENQATSLFTLINSKAGMVMENMRQTAQRAEVVTTNYIANHSNPVEIVSSPVPPTAVGASSPASTTTSMDPPRVMPKKGKVSVCNNMHLKSQAVVACRRKCAATALVSNSTAANTISDELVTEPMVFVDEKEVELFMVQVAPKSQYAMEDMWNQVIDKVNCHLIPSDTFSKDLIAVEVRAINLMVNQDIHPTLVSSAARVFMRATQHA